MEILGRTNLLALRELAAHGTMAAAADVLGVTPGAVSQQISGLEARVGVPLIARIGRGVQLTDAGHVLVQHSARILAAQDDALAAIQSTRTDVVGSVTIGLFGSSAAVLPSITQAVAAAHPGLAIRTREIDVDDALAAVRRGVVDLAFGLDYSEAPIPRVEKVALTPLRSEQFALATMAGAHARLERVDLSDARDWEWILPPVTTHYGYAMRVACRRAGFEPTVVHEVTDTAASLALAASGAGVTPVTAMMRALAPHPSVAVVTLKQDIRRYLCLAEQVRSDHRPSVQAVADIIRSVVGGDEPVGSGRAAVR